MVEKGLTPLMKQYFEVKEQYPTALVLFQVGDFYEIFFEDAKKASAILGITLTTRGTHMAEPIPLAGVPLHVVDHYVSKLIRAGFNVVLVDQLELPKPGKVVKRGVTSVLTPGTLTDSKHLDAKSPSYLCVFFPAQQWTLLFVELLTGQLFATELHEESFVFLEAELHRFMPDEIVVPENKIAFGNHLQRQGYHISYEKWTGEKEEAHQWFKQQFQREWKAEAITMLYTYLKRTNEQGLHELKQQFFYKPEDYLLLDASTQRNLELVTNTQDGSSSNTLFSVLDHAMTSMGSRMLKKWLLRPLIRKESIEERLDVIDVCMEDHSYKSELRVQLQHIGDIERIVGRIALKRAHIVDYTALLKALGLLPGIKSLLLSKQVGLMRSLAERISDFTGLVQLLQTSLNEDTSKEWLIKEGYNSELDHLRKLAQHGSHAIIALEETEQKRTGINSLKIRFNQVNGYGIEVTKPNVHLVPSDYIRIQTLANRERFTTQALKDLEYDITRARTEIAQVEKELFEGIKQRVEKYVSELKKAAYAVAYIDALAALAQVAYEQGYVRPQFNDRHELTIKEGRHPVVAQRLRSAFIPNDVHLTNNATVWLITGPNMGGKSTFLRQTALIVLMAQMGSYVPASSANIPIIDRIFTRIGAADNVAEGKSTFLVEMEETALICTQATAQSLVILDEVGRGTSTFDGLALAQAIVEYIAQQGAHCLFATHYHELTSLSEKNTAIRSYYAASTKTAQGIVLLHKILPGVADGSFGLEVAALAQLPTQIIDRARVILTELTHAPQHPAVTGVTLDKQRVRELESYITQRDRETHHERIIAAQLTEIDCEQITPKQALDTLWRLKELLHKE